MLPLNVPLADLPGHTAVRLRRPSWRELLTAAGTLYVAYALFPGVHMSAAQLPGGVLGESLSLEVLRLPLALLPAALALPLYVLLADRRRRLGRLAPGKGATLLWYGAILCASAAVPLISIVSLCLLVGMLLPVSRTGRAGVAPVDALRSERRRRVVARETALREELVREEERHRLKRDLHDDLGPALVAIRLRLDTAASLLPDQPESPGRPGQPGLHRIITDAAAEAARAVGEMRRVIADEPPSGLAGSGLVDALELKVKELHAAGPRLTLEAPDGPLDLSPPVQTVAYRIATEALANALRHAHAHRIEVLLVQDAQHVRLTVSDDGVGLPPQPAPGGGTGLRSMARRAAEAGGSCVALPREDRRGTEVSAVFPRGA
ncbi:sensor histidine kinase [Streptomyces iconiensis]|uniref:histidine kinase n=1 Tax=Streptomyces iconiensis TaxID=1384038 RepID=A0ABT7A2F8_9ACTN|nr:ATP-binding protein [Streptomyces iconiensis]MDJ1135252.1 histidine kinase [Streptomyces iconiensis]